jgi:hypothetical protein
MTAKLLGAGRQQLSVWLVYADFVETVFARPREPAGRNKIR